MWNYVISISCGKSSSFFSWPPRSILEGIQGACEEANCTVVFDLSDDAQVVWFPPVPGFHELLLIFVHNYNEYPNMCMNFYEYIAWLHFTSNMSSFLSRFEVGEISKNLTTREVATRRSGMALHIVARSAVSKAP